MKTDLVVRDVEIAKATKEINSKISEIRALMKNAPRPVRIATNIFLLATISFVSALKRFYK